MGYEFLSRGFKCVSFTNRFPVYGLEHLFEKKGLFWTDSSDFGEMKKLIDDQPYLDGIMKKGKEKAINVADSVLSKVYDVVGFSKT